jgi:hypothetical protein
MSTIEAVAKPVDLTDICSTFPEKPENEVQRDNMSSTLFSMMKNNLEIVVVEGEEGGGKTTLLAQFARLHGSHTFSIFVRDASRYAWDPIMVAENLHEQIQFALGNPPVRQHAETDIRTLLRTSIRELHRKANQEKAPYYFMVDGLDEIPAEASTEVQQIIECLPIGLSTFRFLLSGSSEKLTQFRPGQAAMKSWRLPPFSLDETAKYFNDIPGSADFLQTIYKASGKGTPGKLAAIRRLCQGSAGGAKEVLSNLSDHAPDLLEKEWSPVAKAPDQMHLALAALCFDNRQHNVETLATFCGMEKAKLEQFIDSCTFLQHGSTKDREITFVSYFKRFAAKKLEARRREVLGMAISQLMKQPESTDALDHLPLYLNESEQYEQLLEYLSPTHIGRMIECSESWLPLHQKTDLGVATSRHLSRDGELIRFGLQRAAITSLESCERRRSEIEAYIALGDFKTAYALAETAIAKEDRLHIFAIIGSAKRKQKLPIEPELKEQIAQLYDQVEKTGLGNRAVEIAVDLFSCQPELAINLIHTSQRTGASQENIDIAFANLSVKTLLERSREADPAETGAKMRAQMRTPKIQKFVDTVSMLWGGYSAAKVIALIDQWENPGDRIYVMRIWTTTNRRREDAAEVVEHALDTIIKTTEFAPNAKIYRELAMPLPYMPSLETAKKLVARFDGIKGIIEPAGPTEEYVWIQLLLAAAEARYDKDAARNRFIDTYLYIGELKDLATKTACTARLASALQRADPTREYDVKDELHKVTTEQLEKCLLQLLTETADHYQAVEPAIHALTGNAPDRALALANALNTEPRRDFARVKIIESLTARDPQKIDPPFMEKVLGEIRYSANRSRALLGMVKGLEPNKDKVAHLIPMLMALGESSRTMPSPEERCEFLLLLHAICAVHSSKKTPTFLAFLQTETEGSWSEIDVGYKRVDMGFRITVALGASAPDFARAFLAKVQDLRKNMVLDSEEYSHTHIKCFRLALRAFSGLIRKKLYSPGDLEAIGELINEIPGASIRAIAWGDVALRLYLEGAQGECKDVVTQRVKQAINEIPGQATERRAAAIIGTAPALFCAHAGTAEEMIETLPQNEKDVAYRQICGFLLTKELPYEPYERNAKGGEILTIEEIWDICRLGKKIETDVTVYGLIKELVDHIEQKKNWNSYTREKRADAIGRIRELLGNLPNPKFIKHEGFRILGEAQLARLEKSGGGAGLWDELIARAKNFPNHSDQAFVFATMAGAMPDTPSLLARKRSLFEEAEKKTATLSSRQDRIQRYISIFEAALDFDRAICKKALKAATQDSQTLESNDVSSIREQLIDMAYRIDKDFAATLASGLDKDPARKAKQLEMQERVQNLGMQQRVETLKLRDALQKGDARLTPGNGQEPEQSAEAAWMFLRSLHSGKLGGINLNEGRRYVQEASTFSLTHAYPVLALVIESIVRANKTKDDLTHLKPLFKATLIGAQLTYQIAAKMRNLADAHRLNATGNESEDQSLIKSGERKKALEKIRVWVRNHAKGSIRICDHYFGPENLDLVQLIRVENPDIPIAILTSRQHQNNEKVQQPWEEAYQAYWRSHVSESDPGEVRIAILGSKETGEMPIHDRWCLSEDSGLRFGTSANSIGMAKASEISEIAATDLPGISALVDKHLNGRVTTSTGEKLLSMGFYLG